MPERYAEFTLPLERIQKAVLIYQRRFLCGFILFENVTAP